MHKKSLSERDICTKFITPALENAGWDTMNQVREEVSFARQLEPRTIGSIRQTLAYLDPDGTMFDYPEWWIEGILALKQKNPDN